MPVGSRSPIITWIVLWFSNNPNFLIHSILIFLIYFLSQQLSITPKLYPRLSRESSLDLNDFSLSSFSSLSSFNIPRHFLPTELPLASPPYFHIFHFILHLHACRCKYDSKSISYCKSHSGYSKFTRIALLFISRIINTCRPTYGLAMATASLLLYLLSLKQNSLWVRVGNPQTPHGQSAQDFFLTTQVSFFSTRNDRCTQWKSIVQSNCTGIDW